MLGKNAKLSPINLDRLYGANNMIAHAIVNAINFLIYVMADPWSADHSDSALRFGVYCK